MLLADLLKSSHEGCIIVRPGWSQENSNLVVGRPSGLVYKAVAGILYVWTPTDNDLEADDWYSLPLSPMPSSDLLPTKE